MSLDHNNNAAAVTGPDPGSSASLSLLDRHYSTIGIGDVFLSPPPTQTHPLPSSYFLNGSNKNRTTSSCVSKSFTSYELVGVTKATPSDFVVREIAPVGRRRRTIVAGGGGGDDDDGALVPIRVADLVNEDNYSYNSETQTIVQALPCKVKNNKKKEPSLSLSSSSSVRNPQQPEPEPRLVADDDDDNDDNCNDVVTMMTSNDDDDRDDDDGDDASAKKKKTKRADNNASNYDNSNHHENDHTNKKRTLEEPPSVVDNNDNNIPTTPADDEALLRQHLCHCCCLSEQEHLEAALPSLSSDRLMSKFDSLSTKVLDFFKKESACSCSCSSDSTVATTFEDLVFQTTPMMMMTTTTSSESQQQGVPVNNSSLSSPPLRRLIGPSSSSCSSSCCFDRGAFHRSMRVVFPLLTAESVPVRVGVTANTNPNTTTTTTNTLLEQEQDKNNNHKGGGTTSSSISSNASANDNGSINSSSNQKACYYYRITIRADPIFHNLAPLLCEPWVDLPVLYAFLKRGCDAPTRVPGRRPGYDDTHDSTTTTTKVVLRLRPDLPRTDRKMIHHTIEHQTHAALSTSTVTTTIATTATSSTTTTRTTPPLLLLDHSAPLAIKHATPSPHVTPLLSLSSCSTSDAAADGETAAKRSATTTSAPPQPASSTTAAASTATAIVVSWSKMALRRRNNSKNKKNKRKRGEGGAGTLVSGGRDDNVEAGSMSRPSETHEHERSHGSSNSCSTNLQPQQPQDKSYPHVLFVLKKMQVEHLTAQQFLAQHLSCRQASIGLAGIKDMHAITYQFCTVANYSAQRLIAKALFLSQQQQHWNDGNDNNNSNDNAIDDQDCQQRRRIEIGSIYPVDWLLNKGDLEGNRFEIIVRNLRRVKVVVVAAAGFKNIIHKKCTDNDDDGDGATNTTTTSSTSASTGGGGKTGDLVEAQLREELVPCDLKHLQAMVDRITQLGFINFYGEQRVGVAGLESIVGVRAFDIGRAMLRQDFRKAVDLIMTGRLIVRHADDIESEGVRTVRQTWKETGGDPFQTWKVLPRQRGGGSTVLARERLILKGLKRYGDPLLALRCLHFHERMFWISAYQSYVWNAMATERIRIYGTSVAPGDLIVLQNGEVTVVEEALTSEARLEDVVLPLPGYDVRYPTNGIGELYTEFLAREGVTFQKDGPPPESTSKGSYRRLVARAYNFSHEPILRQDVKEDGNNKNCDDNGAREQLLQHVKLRFDLPTGSYATMLLRDFMLTTVVRDIKELEVSAVVH